MALKILSVIHSLTNGIYSIHQPNMHSLQNAKFVNCRILLVYVVVLIQFHAYDRIEIHYHIRTFIEGDLLSGKHVVHVLPTGKTFRP